MDPETRKHPKYGGPNPGPDAASAPKTAKGRKGQGPNRPRGALRFLPVALIFAAALLAYAPVYRAGFIWDDDVFLYNNPRIHASDGLYRFWFTTEPTDYFPLTSSLLWFEWRLWGPNPAGYHIVNVLLHAASAVLLWRVLLRLWAPGAWLAGLLFAVHPVAAASVAWISEIKNTLSMVLCLASLLAWLKADEEIQIADGEADRAAVKRARSASSGSRGAGASFNGAPGALNSAFRNRSYVVALVLFLLALLAKTSVVIAPAVLLLCAWWRRGRIGRGDLLRAIPFAALSGVLALVTVWYQYHNAIGAAVVRTDGPAARAAVAGWTVWFYLYKALLPVHLCPIYPRWTPSAALPAFIPGLLYLALLALAAGFRRSWGRPLLFALGYFLVALLPVLGFLNIYFMRYSLVAGHWQYLALAGVVSLAAGVLGWVMERPGAPRTVARAAAAALVLAGAVLTYRQTLIYHDVETLWRGTLAQNPKAWVAQSNLGRELIVKARAFTAASPPRPDAAQSCYEEARRHLDRGIALGPDYADAYVWRGNISADAGHYAEAFRDYDQAIAQDPKNAEAHVNRGNIYSFDRHYAEAFSDYDQAIHLKPDDAGQYYLRSLLYRKTGRTEEALRDLDQAIQIAPEYVEAYLQRGSIHAAARRYAESLRDYGRAIALKPGDADEYLERGNVYIAANDYPSAVADFTRAIRINPNNANAYADRAIAYYAAKDFPHALSDASAAQRLGAHLHPDFLRALSQDAGH